MQVKRKLSGQIYLAFRAYAAMQNRKGLITLTSGPKTTPQDAVPDGFANGALESFVQLSARQCAKGVCINFVRAPLQLGRNPSNDSILNAYINAIQLIDSEDPSNV